MFKNIIIFMLLLIAVFSCYIAVRNARPVCQSFTIGVDDFGQRNLECIYNLGDIPQSKANVFIVPKE